VEGTIVSDLVSRLLEAIQANEQKARKVEESDGYSVHISDSDVEDFFRDNDPSSVLRRCEADRETVNHYRLLRARNDWSQGLGETLGALRFVVERIARTYGITEEGT
jgi:hypothetical protein